MTYTMTVSPDFPPKKIAGWYIFNTWFQKQFGINVRLKLFNSFEEQREAIRNDEIDIIYANPFDASMLVREKGFIALSRPAHKSDETMVVVNAENPANEIEDLQPGLHLVSTDDPDVHLMGMIMLEPAELNAENIHITRVDSYPLVAKALINGDADVGFFLSEAFTALTNLTKSQLKVLVESQISVIQHVFLVGPRLADRSEEIRTKIIEMHNDLKGKDVISSLGFEQCDDVTEEDVEFMIDLMDTLA